MTPNAKSNAGNALFIILIGVALFAALSYAVTGTSQTGTSGITQDSGRISGTGIIQYGTLLRQSIMQMQSRNNCSDTQISFDSPHETGYVNATSPADKSCHVFDGAGGGVTWRAAPVGINTDKNWFFTGRNRVIGLGTASGEELLAILPINSEETCRQINKTLKLPTHGFGVDTTTPEKFMGGYSYGNNLPDNGGISSEVEGLHAVCLKTLTSGGWYAPVGEDYFFYQVLLVR